jgi:hypothetical protein
MVPELLDQLRALRRHNTHVAVPMGHFQNAYISVDVRGRPGLFLCSHTGSPGPHLRSRNVSLLKRRPFRIEFGDGTSREESYDALLCETEDTQDIQCFLSLLDVLSGKYVEPHLPEDALDNLFHSLTRLFSTATDPDPRFARIGLWGELYCMSRMGGIKRWAPYWHKEVSGLFDFSLDDMRIEVKTTTGPDRVHHFSHRQVFAPSGERIVIASLVVKNDDEGLSLRSLIEHGRKALSGDVNYEKLERAIRQAGMKVASETGPSFNEKDAWMNLCWFVADEVPQFRSPEPAGVSLTQ